MCFFMSFMPATFWLVVAYFVYFASTKAEGTAQKLGKVLSIWILTIATFIPIMGAYVTLSGLCPIGEMMSRMGG